MAREAAVAGDRFITVFRFDRFCARRFADWRRRRCRSRRLLLVIDRTRLGFLALLLLEPGRLGQASGLGGARRFRRTSSFCSAGGLRGLGVPTAYVSGYLRTIPPEGQPRLEGADAYADKPFAGKVDFDFAGTATSTGGLDIERGTIDSAAVHGHTCTISATATAITATNGVYDLELVSGANVTRLLEGLVIISPEVTR